MKIQDQTVVTMTYVLREKDENGRIIQEATKTNPFTFICGMRQVLPKFEENLLGKEPGDHYYFYLTPEEGYGVRDERNILNLDKEIFMQNGVLHEMVKVGAQLIMQTQNGPMAAVVREIGDNHVKMDFNHDLAGVYLCFSGEILDVRETVDEDFAPGGCSGCGGDCEGSCEGGCEGCSQNDENTQSADDWYWKGRSADSAGDYEEAVRCYKKAARGGHADAACELAILYHTGKGVPKDKGIAGQWFHRAAALGDSFAQNEVGDAYYKKKKYIWASDWYAKAAQQGNDTGMYNLAKCFHHGGIAPANSVACNYNEAIRIYRECEKKTSDDVLRCQCEYQIGMCYEFGLNNISEAREWYQLAARKQYRPAILALQQMEMVEKDRSGVESWFEKGESAFWEISYFRDGDTWIKACESHGNPARYCEAMRWWSKAAFDGHARSQYYLALNVYQRGYGTPISEAEALEWFTKAAERGYQPAQEVLAKKYKYGDGAIADVQKSIRWQQLADKNR